MKKYIFAILSLFMLISFVSCGEDTVRNDGRSMADDVRAGIRDVENGVERAADDMTDGTTMNKDYSYNVDNYNPYGPEAK